MRNIVKPIKRIPIMPSLSRLFSRLSMVAMAALLCTYASAAPVKNSKWLQTYTLTPTGGYMLGNPAAKNHIVEYVSYTCPHCAHFETDDLPKLKSSYIASGDLSFEIRPYYRDYIDLTVAMLARCGGTKKFFANHNYFMATQADWRARSNRISAKTASHIKAEYASKADELSDNMAYMLGAYSEMDLASLARTRGMTPAAATACLSDKLAQKKILDITDEAVNTYLLPGTPSFLFNGKPDLEIYDYASIKARIEAR